MIEGADPRSVAVNLIWLRRQLIAAANRRYALAPGDLGARVVVTLTQVDTWRMIVALSRAAGQLDPSLMLDDADDAAQLAAVIPPAPDQGGIKTSRSDPPLDTQVRRTFSRPNWRSGFWKLIGLFLSRR